MKSPTIATLAVLAALVAVPSTAMAAQSWDDWYALSVQTGERAIANMPPSEANRPPAFVPMTMRMRPTAGTPTFFVNFVATGLNAANVPCFNCADGTPNTIGLPAPYNYVTTGSTWQYNVSWTNISSTGTCVVSYAVTSGKTKISGASTKVNESGGGAYDWGWQAKPVTYSGPAVVTGKVVCNGKFSKATAKMIFQ